MNKSILKTILDQPVDKLIKIGKPLPNKESLRLYREILKFSNEFNWTNEKGQQWRDLIRTSAKKEFELARDEKDPMMILKIIVTSREAMTETRARMGSKLHQINQNYSQKIHQ